MSLRSAVVRRSLHSCLKATGLRLVHLPEVVDARDYVLPPRQVDAVHLVVDRRAIVMITYIAGADRSVPPEAVVSFGSLEPVLRTVAAERIGLEGRAATPNPKRALELRKAGRWQEVLAASERVEAPMRARLEAWLGGWRFALLRGALKAVAFL